VLRRHLDDEPVDLAVLERRERLDDRARVRQRRVVRRVGEAAEFAKIALRENLARGALEQVAF
jgi:hypothetical protein